MEETIAKEKKEKEEKKRKKEEEERERFRKLEELAAKREAQSQ